MLTNKNSQSTTALNHCVDCILLSSPAASPRVSWRAAEARFYSWRKLLSGHKYFFIHTRASRSDRILLVNIERNFNANDCDVNLFEGPISVYLTKFSGVRQMADFASGRFWGVRDHLFSPSVSLLCAEIRWAKKIGRKVMRTTNIATTFVTGRSRGRVSCEKIQMGNVVC